MMTTQEFIKHYGLEMSFFEVDENPNMLADDNWGDSATHYSATITRKGKSFATYYSKGRAHEYGVTLSELLECLASDCGSIDDSFEHWAENFGYDTDSRKAERIFNHCKKQRVGMRKLLGYNQTAMNRFLELRFD